MGGALRSLGNSTSAIFLNPAAMAETRVYHVEGLAQVSPEARRQVYGGVVSDSVTGRLAGSIAVVGGFIDGDGFDRSFLDARLALAYPITERLFIGLTGKYARIYQEGTLGAGSAGGLGESAASGGLRDPDDTDGGYLPIVDEFSFDAGLVLKVSDSVYLSAVGQNLTYPGNGLLPTTVGGGVGIGTTDFSIEADALADFSSYLSTSMRLMVGGEYLVGNHVPIRLGYRFDQGAGEHSLSGGLGYVGNEFAIEGSVRRALADPGATTIFIGLSYHLDAAGLTRSPAEL
ncbi:Hypothetical protein CAP_3132 [Chondromyces apiculatus DSM 436]|uniref:PorV/PorQ family protein n=2 Tax=Chondromyces apiculatus TaxID=51 RepID=A0A017T8P1_9BACT|nr:Hypothetical protein CAP_3132 [Chondromyces apiculatus DSM 436]